MNKCILWIIVFISVLIAVKADINKTAVVSIIPITANNSNLSDERLKKDIVSLESVWDKIKGIEIVKYIYDKPFNAYSKDYNKKSKISEEFYLLFLYPEDRDNPIMRKAVNWNGPCEAEHNYGDYYDCGVEINYPKPESIRFKGKVFVLSDFKVTSAGAVFVGLIKDYSIGKIIGTETDQSPSNDGQGCYFLLPNSNVMAMGATTYAIRPNGDPSTTRGVIPDYEVTQLKEDTEKGIDTVMDFTMKLINK